MTVQHVDLFHCLACGRVAYEAHESPSPDCCGQPMVRAVADVVKELSPSAHGNAGTPADAEDHALFAEVLELAQWCHRLRDVDVSRTEELANRLSVLHQALIDQIEGSRRANAAVPAVKSQVASERSQAQGQRLVTMFARFTSQLRSGPSPFENWGQICDRLDELVAEVRQYAQAETGLSGGATANGHSAR